MATEKESKYLEGIGWRRDTEHSMHRRMQDHDYYDRCIYMITMSVEGRQPLLGRLVIDQETPEVAAHIEPSALGREVERCWFSIKDHYPDAEPLKLQLMPDHIHGLLFIKRDQEAHIGKMLRGFKIGCSWAFWEQGASSAGVSSAGFSSAGFSSAGFSSAGFSSSKNISMHRTASPAASPAANGTASAAGNAAASAAGKAANGTASPAANGTANAAGNAAASAPASPAASAPAQRAPLFEAGYQDSILMGKNQLEHMIRYMEDNPKRLAIKRLHPDLFRVVRELKVKISEAPPQNTEPAAGTAAQQATAAAATAAQQATAAAATAAQQATATATAAATAAAATAAAVQQATTQELTFAAIGNRWLLEKPLRLQVRCHNNTTPENLQLIARQKTYFLERGKREGAVIISPCISAGEKEIARAALDAKIPLIVILENGFPPMYKPPGKYFEACTAGLLLMLAPWPYHMETRKITRQQCLALNAMAKMLSSATEAIE